MTQTYDPNESEQWRYLAGSGFGGGAGNPGGAGLASEPPPPRRPSHKRRLIMTGAVALAAGAATGALIGSQNPTSAGTATATSQTPLPASQVAAPGDPGLDDVLSTHMLREGLAPRPRNARTPHRQV